MLKINLMLQHPLHLTTRFVKDPNLKLEPIKK
uniref:Uncharacterized protein n=1 Tax=Arundo donax TaxID=35708 RepID=A0A0A9FQP4_ARUDO